MSARTPIERVWFWIDRFASEKSLEGRANDEHFEVEFRCSDLWNLRQAVESLSEQLEAAQTALAPFAKAGKKLIHQGSQGYRNGTYDDQTETYTFRVGDMIAAYKIAGTSDPGDAPQSSAPQSDEPSGARGAPFPAIRQDNEDACGDCGHPHVNGRSGSCSKFTCDCREWVAPVSFQDRTPDERNQHSRLLSPEDAERWRERVRHGTAPNGVLVMIDEIERLYEQLEAFQELAQDASDITQVGHGLELDVPVNLGSVKWVESAYHVLLTMASLASNPASEPEAS